MNKDAYRPGQKNRPSPYVRKQLNPISENNFDTHPDWILALQFIQDSLFWEAHEVLESLWKELPPGEEKIFLQTLILLCGTQLKNKETEEAKKRMQSRSLELLQSIGSQTIFGYQIERLRKKIQTNPLEALKSGNFHLETPRETPSSD